MCKLSSDEYVNKLLQKYNCSWGKTVQTGYNQISSAIRASFSSRSDVVFLKHALGT